MDKPTLEKGYGLHYKIEEIEARLRDLSSRRDADKQDEKNKDLWPPTTINIFGIAPEVRLKIAEMVLEDLEKQHKQLSGDFEAL